VGVENVGAALNQNPLDSSTLLSIPSPLYLDWNEWKAGGFQAFYE
jgi:hypothetical protein